MESNLVITRGALVSNPLYDSLKLDESKALLGVVEKAAVKAAANNREAYLIIGHAVHDIQAGKLHEKEGYKTAGEMVAAFFPGFSGGRYSQLAKAWETWGDAEKLSKTDKAILQNTASIDALYNLAGMTEAQRAKEAETHGPAFSSRDAKAAADRYKEKGKASVVKEKQYLMYTGEVWVPSERFSPADFKDVENRILVNLPNGDKLGLIIGEDGIAEGVQFREVKPEKKEAPYDESIVAAVMATGVSRAAAVAAAKRAWKDSHKEHGKGKGA